MAPFFCASCERTFNIVAGIREAEEFFAKFRRRKRAYFMDSGAGHSSPVKPSPLQRSLAFGDSLSRARRRRPDAQGRRPGGRMTDGK